MPREETPQLGKFVVREYEGGDLAFPIVIVAMDNRATGYAIPADLAACPDPRFTSHRFFDVEPTSVDARVHWVYLLLPGPIITTTRLDEDSAVIAISRQRKDISAITSGESVVNGVWSKTTREGPDTNWAYEVIETRTMPTTVLTSQAYTAEVRGRLVNITVQTGPLNSLPPETGNGVVSSQTVQISGVLDRRTTHRLAGNSLPADESWIDYRHVNLPTRIFSIDHAFYIEGDSVKVRTNINKIDGRSAIRKHRTTISYSFTPPTDYSYTTYKEESRDYDGFFVKLHLSGLFDYMALPATTVGAIVFSTGGILTESYTFAATTPSATAFAGNWYMIERDTEPFGVSGWRTKMTEFYEP